ncbi:putative outer membrane protein [Enhygromyxa salina]|uniref:Putative outer membrane protein n=1 Tax=Enhygromyxa salina TaxID=215803 RepID=A0A0C1ZFH8_9BACT|nr:DUF481 domain-containing protein [Enhygromyxa salina]KIG16409.1 putative outer membrane protein [Enhygromyxa salina]
MSRRPSARSLVLGAALALAVWLWSATATATGLNVEQVRLHPDQDGLYGGVQFGIDFSAGNTNRLDLRSSASLAYRHGRHVAFLLGSSQVSTRTQPSDELSQLLRPESRFVNKANAHLRYNYELLSWLTAEAFTQLERNEFLLLKSRVLFGIGPRFVAVNNGEFSLALGTDYMFEHESLDPARVLSPLPPQTNVHRWSSYLSLIYAANDRLNMSSTTYVQPRFDLFSDLRLLSEAMLDVTLLEPISIRLTLRLRWDSDPSSFCSDPVGLGGCPAGKELRLREFDIGVENSISVSF